MPPASPAARRRVVVRFKPDVNLPYNATAVEKLLDQAGHDWSEISNPHPGTRFGLLFPRIDPVRLKSYEQLTPAVGHRPFRFTSYFVVDCPPNVSADDVVERLDAWQSVEKVYVQPGAAPPPSSVLATNDLLSHLQGYLDCAPDGVGARWVWNNTPANGTGVGLVDLEQGWELNHEELASAAIPPPIYGLNYLHHNHGLKVLGVVRASDNDRGIVGIAPRCGVRVVSPWTCRSTPCPDHTDPCEHDYNVAEAIVEAVHASHRGDVLLLEAQTGMLGSSCYAVEPWLPVEVEDVVRDAIILAVTNQIVVVEAAANGNVDLDAFTRGTDRILDPTPCNDAFCDSGAILVGAAKTAALTAEEKLRSRLGTSNYGNRVDCFAWGRGVQTTLQFPGSTALNEYGDLFAETSSAAAIVAGAAVLLQSWRDTIGEPRYTPARLRELFRDPTLNTASHSASDRIGVMPNLKAIIESELAALAMVHHLPRRYQGDAARLLHDRNGTPILEPLREHLAKLDPAERDLAVALAALDLADQAQRKSIAKRLRKAARRILKDARKKPKHGR